MPSNELAAGEAVVLLWQSCKQAADSTLSYALQGQLVLSSSGWALLQVPNDIGNGAFKAMSLPGVEQPSNSKGSYNAHISVIRPEELERIGGPAKLDRYRGSSFSYTLGNVREIANPGGWAEVAKVWVIEVQSPELMRLRRSLGLGAPKYPFHITFAIQKRKIRKKEASLIHQQRLANNIKEQIADARENTNEPASASQAAAGNYKKGKIQVHGLTITLENPKGSTRSGTDSDGKEWSVKMKSDYGYINRTEGRDGDHIDVFLGPDVETELVYVVDQIDPKTKRFDEHKCMIGFRTQIAAKAAYLENYTAGWQGLKSITPMTLQQFKRWLRDGDLTKPVAGVTVKAAAPRSYYLDALTTTPIIWDRKRRLAENLLKHITRVRDRGATTIQEAASNDRLLNAADPDRASKQLQAYLNNQRPATAHPVDRLIYGNDV